MDNVIPAMCIIIFVIGIIWASIESQPLTVTERLIAQKNAAKFAKDLELVEPVITCEDEYIGWFKAECKVIAKAIEYPLICRVNSLEAGCVSGSEK